MTCIRACANAVVGCAVGVQFKHNAFSHLWLVLLQLRHAHATFDFLAHAIIDWLVQSPLRLAAAVARVAWLVLLISPISGAFAIVDWLLHKCRYWLDETDGEGTAGGDGNHGYDTTYGPVGRRWLAR